MEKVKELLARLAGITIVVVFVLILAVSLLLAVSLRLALEVLR